MSPSAVWQLLINRSEAVYVFCARFFFVSRLVPVIYDRGIRSVLSIPVDMMGRGIKRPLGPPCERHLVSFSSGNPERGFPPFSSPPFSRSGAKRWKKSPSNCISWTKRNWCKNPIRYVDFNWLAQRFLVAPGGTWSEPKIRLVRP